jgi:Asp-tRNA(Asn)/Glu-tRNA(Gln) amidotransferase A subunit family amidase
MPQVTMPVAPAGEMPAGLSLIAATYEDSFLLSTANRVASVLSPVS